MFFLRSFPLTPITPSHAFAFLTPSLLPPTPTPLCALMWRLSLTLLDDITLCCLLACLPAWGTLK